MRITPFDGDGLDKLLAWFEDLVVAVLHRIVEAAARLFGDGGGEQAITGGWVHALDDELLPGLGKVWKQAAGHTADQLRRDGLTTPDAAAFLAAARNRLVGVGDDLWAIARDQLAQGVRAGEDIRQLTARLQAAPGMGEGRARTVARTEVLSAMNASALAQVRVLDDPTVIKEWLAVPGVDGRGCDVRTRPSHCRANGMRVRVGERFHVGAGALDFPGDPTGPPEESINCRCSCAYDLDDEPLTAADDPYIRDTEGKFAEHPGGAGVAGQVRSAKAALQSRKASGKLPAGADPKRDVRAAKPGQLLDRWRRPSQGPLVLDEASVRVRDTMQAAYTFRDDKSGLSTEPTSVMVQDDGTVVTGIDVKDRDGQDVGAAYRGWKPTTDGGLEVTHNRMQLDPEVQGGGFSQRFNAHAEDVYRAAGVDRVSLEADIDVGGYAWATQGYDFAGESEMEYMRGRFAAQLHGLGVAVDEQTQRDFDGLQARSTAADFAAGTAPTPYEWAMLGRHQPWTETDPASEKDHLMWPGKAVMMGSDWNAVKPLTAAVTVAAASSDSRRRLLDDAALTSLAWADTVAEQVPADPRDAHPGPDGETDYPEHHHLVSASPDLDRIFLDLHGDSPLTAAGPSFARRYPRDRQGRFAETDGGLAGIAADLVAGHPTTCTPGQLDGLMRHLADDPASNLTHLQVEGAGNEHLFRDHARDIPRADMPQLPKTAAGLEPFGLRLRQENAGTVLEVVDPRTLRGTQNQLNSAAVGHIYQRAMAGDWNRDYTVITARGGEVLDGHHRWAAASAAAVAGHPVPFRILRVDLSLDRLLELAQEMSGPRHSHGQPRRQPVTAAATSGDGPDSPPPDPGQPWLWADGQWVLVATDTGDGIPDDLELDERPLTAALHDDEEAAPDGKRFHLPGRHDQKTHGHRFRTPGNPASGLTGRTGATKPDADTPETLTPVTGRRFDTDSGRAFIKEHYAAWQDGLSSSEYSGLKFYQSPGFALINGQLRGLKPDEIKADVSFGEADLKRARKAGNDLRKGIRKAPPLPETVVAFRGFSADQFGLLKPGMRIRDEAFVSMALTDDVGAVGKATKPGKARIELPAGMRVGAGSAREIIAAPGSEFEIVAVREEGGVTHVDMRMVGNGG